MKSDTHGEHGHIGHDANAMDGHRGGQGTAPDALLEDRLKPSAASQSKVAPHEHEEHSMPGMLNHGAHAAHEAPSVMQHGEHAGAHAGHDKHAGHSVEMFRDKFWISLALTVPTLVWGHMLQRAFGYQAPMFPGAMWIPPVFGTAVFFYGGWVFIHGAVRELKDRLPGMMTLIGLAISVAFVFSAAVTLGFRGMALWEELSTLVTIMLLGHWIEMRSISQAQGALKELAKLLPDTAVRVVGESTEDVPVSALRERDVILIRPGASIPADGAVRQGTSAVNESMITGESKPVDKKEGDKVIAGTVNGAGSLRVEVTGTGERTALAGIMRLVEQAQSSRSRAQALADRPPSRASIRDRTGGDRARHRMPARARPRDPACHRHLDDARCAEWSARA